MKIVFIIMASTVRELAGTSRSSIDKRREFERQYFRTEETSPLRRLTTA